MFSCLVTDSSYMRFTSIKKERFKKMPFDSSSGGMSLVEVLISMSIMAITSMTMMDNLNALMFEGRLTESQLFLKKVAKTIQPRLTKYMQEIQRVLADNDCKGNIDMTQYSMGLTIVPEERKYTIPSDISDHPVIMEAWNRCQTPNEGRGTGQYFDDYTQSKVYYHCFVYEDNGTQILIEAKMIFWNFMTSSPLQCGAMGGQLGRGSQIYYKMYAFKKIRINPVYYSVDVLSGHLVAPKSVFYNNTSNYESNDYH